VRPGCEVHNSRRYPLEPAQFCFLFGEVFTLGVDLLVLDAVRQIETLVGLFRDPEIEGKVATRIPQVVV